MLPAFNLDFKIICIGLKYSFCIMVFISWFFTLSLYSTPRYLYPSSSSSDRIFSPFGSSIPCDDTTRRRRRRSRRHYYHHYYYYYYNENFIIRKYSLQSLKKTKLCYAMINRNGSNIDKNM